MGVDQHTTAVVGTRSFGIRVTSIEPVRLQRLSITAEAGSEWTFDQPGWQPLAFGAGESNAYLWSAWDVIVLPADPAVAPAVVLSVDEPLRAVFERKAGWLLVCETSVRRLERGVETARIGFGGVIESWRWDGDHIVIRLDDRSEHVLSVGDTGVSVDVG